MSNEQYFEQRKGDLIHALEKVYGECTTIEFTKIIDRLRTIGETLIEDNRKMDLYAKQIKKEFQSITSQNEIYLPTKEFKRIIKLYQMEIDKLKKRFIETSEILNSLRMLLTNLPEFTPILLKSIQFLHEAQEKINELNSVRAEINSLKTDNQDIENIEREIKEVQAKRDQKIKEINDEANRSNEQLKQNQIDQINESIQIMQGQKQEMINEMKIIENDIQQIDDKLFELNSQNESNLDEFIQQSKQIETQLINLRSKLDTMKENDPTQKLNDLNTEFQQKCIELQSKKNSIESLEAELNLNLLVQENLKKQTDSAEKEINDLEQELETKKVELQASASQEEWNSIFSTMKSFQVERNPNFQTSNDIKDKQKYFDIDFINQYDSSIFTTIQTLEKNQINARREKATLDSKLDISKSNIEQLKDRLRSLEELIQKGQQNDADSIIEILKMKKKELNDALLKVENEFNELQRSGNSIDMKIQSLNKEKDNLINFSNSNDLKYQSSNSSQYMENVDSFLVDKIDYFLGTPKSTLFVCIYFFAITLFLLIMFYLK